MRQEINKTENQDLSLVVRAIGTDLEHTQVRVIASANADMLFHYWKVGHFILYLQKKEGWGSKVIDNLSKAIRSKYPDKKGYSTRNLIYMCQFAKAYPMEVLIEMGKIEELLNSPLNSAVFFLVRKFYMLRCLLGTLYVDVRCFGVSWVFSKHKIPHPNQWGILKPQRNTVYSMKTSK